MWSSAGDRVGEACRFTADDLVAAGVPVREREARAILHTEAEALNALLRAVGPDRDLVRRTGVAGPLGVAGDRPG